MSALFDRRRRDSEVNRFNAAPQGTWALSPGFWTLLTATLDIADDVNGALDPTLGALIDLWGFGPPGPRSPLLPVPAEEEASQALAVSGWRGLRLNRDACAAVQPGGMKLDFSAVARGHAADRISARLTTLGATAHLVQVGGERLGRGVRPDGQPWWVEIEAAPESPAPRTVAALVDMAVATSTEGPRAFQHEGRFYSHRLDGAAGRPADNGLVSVTAFHASAMQADAFSTALAVMGPFEGPAFAEAMGLAACFLERTPRGLVERLSPAFAAMMDEAG